MPARILAKLATSSALMIAVVLGTVTATTGQVAKPRTAPAPVARPRTAPAPAPKAADKPPLDLNTATAAQMEEELPGVGTATAKKIIAGRPYKSVDDLARAGVPPRTLAAIRPLVTVGPASAPARKAAVDAEKGRPKAVPLPAAPGHVDLNTADAEALETLPGIGPSHARAIIAGRPYKTVDDLQRVKGLGKARIDAIRNLATASAPAPAVVTTPPPVRTPPPVAPPATATTPTTTKGAGTAKTPGRTAAKVATRPAPGPAPAPGKPVNINTADKAALDALPGIGPVKAQAIIDARPFKSIDDIKRVKGIKDFEFKKIQEMITVD